MSQPPLDSTLIDTNITNGTTSPIDPIPVGKMPDLTPRTRPTESSTWPTDSSKQKGKAHVPADPDSDHHCQTPHRANLIFWMIAITVNPKKETQFKKKHRKHTRQDSSDSSLSNSNPFNDSDYICKRRKKKICRERDPIKLCARLMSKLLTTAYKSNIIRFKLD